MFNNTKDKEYIAYYHHKNGSIKFGYKSQKHRICQSNSDIAQKEYS
jgi:hypothetical protein